MDRAGVMEGDESIAIRASARSAYRAYQQGIEDLYFFDDLERVKARLRRRMHNPLLLARHATYLSMLADIAIASDISALEGGEGR